MYIVIPNSVCSAVWRRAPERLNTGRRDKVQYNYSSMQLVKSDTFSCFVGFYVDLVFRFWLEGKYTLNFVSTDFKANLYNEKMSMCCSGQELLLTLGLSMHPLLAAFRTRACNGDHSTSALEGNLSGTSTILMLQYLIGGANYVRMLVICLVYSCACFNYLV